MYIEKTHDVEISVEPTYLEEHSKPEGGQFVFAYRVKIQNLSDVTLQLISRHWIITDGRGKVEEVRGPGVVGEHPKLDPGQVYEYSSFCPLPTPTGNMRGSYQMLSSKGEKYDVSIPLFFLRGPISTLH
jgi:ApaG protein